MNNRKYKDCKNCGVLMVSVEDKRRCVECNTINIFQSECGETQYGPLWEERRTHVLERDGFRCQDCGLEDVEHTEKYGQGLHVHHKTPYREFESDQKAHNIENLITLCASCHGTRESKI